MSQETVSILVDINISKRKGLEDLCKRQGVTISEKLCQYIKECLAMSESDFEILRTGYNPRFKSKAESCVIPSLSHRGLFNLATRGRESTRSLARIILHVMLDRELMKIKHG